MFDYDRWQEIYSVLRNNVLRTILTALGVAWGIFMLIVMLGAGTGLKNGTIKGFGNMATNSVFIWGERTTVPYKGFPRGRNIRFDNEDTKMLSKTIKNLKYIAPRMRRQFKIDKGVMSNSLSVFGDYPDILKIEGLDITEGRFINKFDIEENKKVAVIGIGVKKMLFSDDETIIGEYIKIQGVFFKIVGIYDINRPRPEADQNIYIPLTTMQRAYNMGSKLGWYSLTSQDHVPVRIVQEKAMSILKKNHHIAPEDERALGHFNLNKEFEQFSGLFKAINILIWFVGTGTLIAGVIGVGNIMLIVVKERTKEIGIRRAIGATPIKIIRQIISESVFLTSISGFMGLIAGVAVVELINQQIGTGGETFTNPEVDFNIAITALIILIISGVFAGMIPASKAVKIKPIEALRTE